MTPRSKRHRLTSLLTAHPQRTLLVIFVLGVVTAAQPLVTLREQWLGWFPATMGSFLSGTVWGSVVTCTAAAWLASGIRRHGLTDWVAASTRGIRGGYGRPLILCGGLGAAAYTLSFLIMTAVTLRSTVEPPAGLPLGLIAVLPLAWASAFAWSAIGVTLARFVRTEVALPLALIISYSAYIVPAYYFIDTPLLGIAIVDGRQWVELQPSTWQLAAKIILWGGVALMIGSVATGVRRTVEAGAWICVFGLTAVIFVGPTLTEIPGATDRACSGSAPQVCTDQAHAAILPEFSLIASSAAQILPEVLRPKVLDEAVQPEPPEVLPFAPVDGYTSPAFTIDRDATVAALGETLFATCAGARVEDQVTAASLEVWWRSRNGVSVDEPITPGGAPWLTVPELSKALSNGQALSDLPAPAQDAWFDMYGESIARCALDEVRWP